jgi:hypothetical protein
VVSMMVLKGVDGFCEGGSIAWHIEIAIGLSFVYLIARQNNGYERPVHELLFIHSPFLIIQLPVFKQTERLAMNQWVSSTPLHEPSHDHQKRLSPQRPPSSE